jgi:hypothetical protein
LSGQVYCVFLFFCAVSLFGTIVAEVNEIVAHLNHEKKSLDEVLEPYLCIKPGSALMLSNPPLAPLSHSHLLTVTPRSLDAETMFNVRSWERFRFHIEQEHIQVVLSPRHHMIMRFEIDLFSCRALIETGSSHPEESAARGPQAVHCPQD